MNPAAVDIATLLEAEGFGTLAATSGWSLHCHQEPAEGTHVPVTAITVYDTGSWRAPEPNVALDYPTVQLRVRGSTFAEAYARAWAIRDELIARPAESISGTRYSYFGVEGDIMPLDRDDHDRFRLTLNVQLMREPVGKYRG